MVGDGYGNDKIDEEDIDNMDGGNWYRLFNAINYQDENSIES